MVALSIKLPKDLAEMSRQVARRLGITRSELIRQALVHEIEQVKARLERGAMAASLRAMTGTAAAIRENEAHVMLSPWDGLKVESYALVEHCGPISRGRVQRVRIAQQTGNELATILQQLVGL